MSTSAPTSGRRTEEQPEKDHDDSSDDDDSSESDYDFEDGSSQTASLPTTSRCRSTTSHSNVRARRQRPYKLRRENEALRRKLKAMTQKKRMWRHRAAIAAMYHN